jgi:hypothetical protein
VEIIGKQKIWTFSETSKGTTPLTCGTVRRQAACLVHSYMDLATKVAELQFRNRDFVLMFRGQKADYKNKLGYTSVKPSLLRASIADRVPRDTTISARFDKLFKAEKALVAEYEAKKFIGRDRLKRQRILRWAILQHYEVCETPLLDVTQSLRIAASFATHHANGEAYIFVLGIPHISGAITASAEAGIQIVRLASVCPPAAVRPHIQEGYLLGEYPEFASAEQKLLYAHAEMDFGRKLIAKFRFKPETFWRKSGSFPPIGKQALYPPATQDPLCELANAVKAAIAP